MPRTASAAEIDSPSFFGHQVTLNEYELRVVYGLLAWIAYEQNVRQDVAQMVLESEFGVTNVTRLRQADYDAIVRYLVTLRLDVRH